MQLRKQAASPTKTGAKFDPYKVLGIGMNNWETDIVDSRERRVRRLRKLKTHHVSPCRLNRKQTAHWGGESGCG